MREKRGCESKNKHIYKSNHIYKLHCATVPLQEVYTEGAYFSLCIARVAEHSSELQKEDLDKEIAAIKEENRRLREENIQLQAQTEDDTQVNKELQEQLSQLTKHVKVETDKQKRSFVIIKKISFFIS